MCAGRSFTRSAAACMPGPLRPGLAAVGAIDIDRAQFRHARPLQALCAAYGTACPTTGTIHAGNFAYMVLIALVPVLHHRRRPVLRSRPRAQDRSAASRHGPRQRCRPVVANVLPPVAHARDRGPDSGLPGSAGWSGSGP